MITGGAEGWAEGWAEGGGEERHRAHSRPIVGYHGAGACGAADGARAGPLVLRAAVPSEGFPKGVFGFFGFKHADRRAEQRPPPPFPWSAFLSGATVRKGGCSESLSAKLL